ncbi:hypothetical protein [Streptomyces sp. NPDC002463]|uniref:hypothetical protein n=1 Tax=Streptomyces sp. NPDC002463 TaxID=3364645 RepID=UPI0036806160
MGSSRWIYFTDNPGNPQEALNDLREKVFQDEWRNQDPFPESIADLIESGALEEEGAHSILDVDRVIFTDDTDYEEDGTIRIVSPQEVVEYFGNAQPTQERIAEVYRTDPTELPPMFRGSGCCAPVHSPEGDCVGLAFWGMSGD